MWTMLLLVASASLGVVAGSDSVAPGVALGAAPQTLQALHCPPCDRIHCTPRRALRLQCRGGITTGICGCCPSCARTAGETCGGSWDYLGKCDEGLVCAYQESSDGSADTEGVGVCKAVLEPLDVENCRPECTREYCQAHPSEICSARFVSLEKQACHGTCQHTSCWSCLVLTPPPCPQACAPDDPACLHRFGRCLHHHLATPRSPVCHLNLQSEADGHFLCLVPVCPPQ